MKFYFVKNFIDAVFSAFLICFFAYILFNYFFSRNIAIVFSVCSFSLSLIFFFARFQRKNQELLSKKTTLKDTNNLSFWLSTTKKEAVLNKTLNAILSNGYNAKIKNNGIYLTEKKQYIFLILPPDGLKKYHLVRAYNLLQESETAILIDQVENTELFSYAKNFDGKINIENVGFLLPYLGKDFISTLKDVSSQTKDPIFKDFFSKKRAKNFFVFGVVFLCLSFISPIKLYYIVSGGIFIFFFCLCKIFGKE